MIKISVPAWFTHDKRLPRQPLLKQWRQVSTTGRTERGPGYRVGESHHRSKLSDHEVELIRLLREGGMQIKMIAKKFECSPSNISAIVNYRSRIGIAAGIMKVFE